MAEDCIFCKIVAGEIPGELIDSDEHTIAFLDINPATRGHSLVIPRKHSADLLAIREDDLQHCAVAARRLAEKLDVALEADGFNVINSCRPAAWQTVFHFHLHVIPRYLDDPLKLPWVPGPADPDELAKTAELIRSANG